MSSCFLNVKVCQISVYLVYPVNLTHVPAHPSAQSVSVAESAGTDVTKGVKLFWDANFANRSLPGQKNAPLDLRLERLSFLPPGKP